MITKAAAEAHLDKLANSIIFAIKVWRDRVPIRNGGDVNALLSGIVDEQLKLEIQSLHADAELEGSQPDGGGHAFPVAGVHCHAGMSLRDWFAGKVIGSVVSDSEEFNQTCVETGSPARITPSDMAERSYEIADAMLTERAKKKESK